MAHAYLQCNIIFNYNKDASKYCENMLQGKSKITEPANNTKLFRK